MRNITKIFLLIVVAFVVYLLWPRTPNIKDFSPGELAKLQVEEWQAEKAGKPSSALWIRFKIYTSQYHFSPIAAFRMAQSEGAALSAIKPTTDASGEAVSDPNIVIKFTEKFAAMKRHLGANLDADALAHEEYTWRSLLADHVPADQLIGPVSSLLAGLYGGAPADFGEVAADLVNAQGYVFGTIAPTDGTEPLAAAQTTAQEGFQLLKEIAAQPVPEAEAPAN